jgi:hypothetical protein
MGKQATMKTESKKKLSPRPATKKKTEEEARKHAAFKLHGKEVELGGEYACKARISVDLYEADMTPRIDLIALADPKDPNSFEEPLLCLTVCGHPCENRLGDDRILVKDWSENALLIDDVLALGLFEDLEIIGSVPGGNVFPAVWKVK